MNNPTQAPSNELCRSLRKRCGHDSHSVDGCLNCEAADQIEEHEQSFNLRWKADMRAIKRWQEAHPGNDLTWPDHADLCVWLLEQLDAGATAEPAADYRPKPGDAIYEIETDEPCHIQWIYGDYAYVIWESGYYGTYKVSDMGLLFGPRALQPPPVDLKPL